MATPLLATKLYIPQPRRDAVGRPRLLARLEEGGDRALTLVSASAGFGKTTLLSAWLAGRKQPAAWLALDAGESDPARFLASLIAALRTVAPEVGTGALSALQSPQPPPVEVILASLLADLASVAEPFTLVLDDYHACAGPATDQALAFLLDHAPPALHLVIATREDPHLPLARLRARDQLTELRAADLRFTPAEAADFLNRVMGLRLSTEEIAALDARVEGWIAGLQLAAISLRDHPDASRFITNFSGSHHFVLDYLVEEVLRRQPEETQNFLLRTSVFKRLCGPLCDAALPLLAGAGQAMLERLERANLFLIPLDDERRWYRYHHLFAELLRQRLQQNSAAMPDDARWDTAGLHVRASAWYEAQGMEIAAFQQAVAAHDVDRAARLLEGNGMPLQFRGAVTPVLGWLQSLPAAVLDARPALWVMYASSLSMIYQLSESEEKLRAAEAALRGVEEDGATRNLIGHIAAIRALLAATQYQAETVIAQSQRALEYLRPDNLPVRTATIWKLGFAYQLQGNRAAAGRAYREAIAISQASGNRIIELSATTGLGYVQEAENLLPQAAESYQRVVDALGDAPLQVASEAQFGLARIRYEWNDLDAADTLARKALRLLAPDRAVACDLLRVRFRLAQGDLAGASALLAQASQTASQLNFTGQAPEMSAMRVRLLLRQGDLDAAAEEARASASPASQARTALARSDPAAAGMALAALEDWRKQSEANHWPDESLKVTILRALAFDARGARDHATRTLALALTLAEPGGFIRIFLDEGPPMRSLLTALAAQGRMPDYVGKLLAAFETEPQARDASSTQPLIEPLSPRELEVLHLIAQGLSNQEIGARLYLALDTVKGHNQRIFAKLGVQRRTEAVARARQLGLL